ELLGEFGLTVTERTDTRFFCGCGREKVEKALTGVGRKELQEMIQDGKTVEVKCHFCNTPYEFSVEDLKNIVKRSR
ncbi:MAG: Hsp33 family molecular chaperone HslO, partial [Eubacteriales bacterium]|nr:Hsp33 family molecular chaperone HslO [Eubacteriales bacterium]